MLRSLAFQIALTGIVYFIVSSIGLLLAPVLISAYGLSGYGQIILARIFLPNAAFAFLDLGVGETATRVIATARSDNEWQSASQCLTLLAILSVSLSFIVAIPLAFLGEPLSVLFSIDAEQVAGFVQVLRVTAILLPFLFASLVAEGVIKGYEKFAQLRACELVSALVFGGLALWSVWSGNGANEVALGFLAALGLRALLATLFAIRLCSFHSIKPEKWDKEVQRKILAWSRAMLANKILGTLQTQAASPLLGLFSGPIAVGLFDAIVRLPRFAKAIYGLTASTVLPLAARLRAGAATSETSRLGYVGTLGSFILFTPITVMAMVFAQTILLHWLGPALSSHWPWFSLMLIVPLLSASISFGGTMLLADYDATKKINKLSFAQVLIQIILSLVLLKYFTPWSFIIGQVASVILVFPAQLALIMRHLALDESLTKRLAMILLVSVLLALGLRLLLPTLDVLQLLIVMAIAGGACTLTLAAVVIPSRSRRALIDQAFSRWLGFFS